MSTFLFRSSSDSFNSGQTASQNPAAASTASPFVRIAGNFAWLFAVASLIVPVLAIVRAFGGEALTIFGSVYDGTVLGGIGGGFALDYVGSGGVAAAVLQIIMVVCAMVWSVDRDDVARKVGLSVLCAWSGVWFIAAALGSGQMDYVIVGFVGLWGGVRRGVRAGVEWKRVEEVSAGGVQVYRIQPANGQRSVSGRRAA